MNLIALFSNIWVRRAAIVAGVLVALYFAAQYEQHKGAETARKDIAQQIADGIEKTHAADRDELEKKLAPSLAAAAEAKAKADQAQQLFLAVVAQRGAVTQQQAGMSDAQITAAVQKQIGNLADPAVQREILACKSQLPLCEKEAEAAHEDALQSSLAAENWKGAYGDLGDYTSKLETHYADLFNAKTVPERSWRCVKLWRCKKVKVKAPDPATLHRPAVQASAVKSKGV